MLNGLKILKRCVGRVPPLLKIFGEIPNLHAKRISADPLENKPTTSAMNELI